MFGNFKPVVHTVEITDGDETMTLYVREAAAAEVLKAPRNPNRPPIDSIRDTFGFLCKDEEGTRYTKQEIQSMVDELSTMRVSALRKISNAIAVHSGLRDAEEAAKNG